MGVVTLCKSISFTNNVMLHSSCISYWFIFTSCTRIKWDKWTYTKANGMIGLVRNIFTFCLLFGTPSNITSQTRTNIITDSWGVSIDLFFIMDFPDVVSDCVLLQYWRRVHFSNSSGDFKHRITYLLINEHHLYVVSGCCALKAMTHWGIFELSFRRRRRRSNKSSDTSWCAPCIQSDATKVAR